MAARPILILFTVTVPQTQSVHDLVLPTREPVESFLAATTLDIRTDALALPERREPRFQAWRLVEGRRLERGQGLEEVEQGVFCEARLRSPTICKSQLQTGQEERRTDVWALDERRGASLRQSAEKIFVLAVKRKNIRGMSAWAITLELTRRLSGFGW
jgi:hypothetical protein